MLERRPGWDSRFDSDVPEVITMSTEQALRKVAAAPVPAPFPRILCAVDAGRSADEAIAQALTLAGDDAELTFMSVVDVRGFGATRMASLGPYTADQALERARRAARAAGVDAAELIRHGEDPRVVIFDEAHRHDLLVLGTHGEHRTSGFLLGSTPAAALHRSPVPVLIARPARVGTEFPRDILVATDGSPAMGPTVALAAALARRHDARVALLHVDHADRDVHHELAEEATALQRGDRHRADHAAAGRPRAVADRRGRARAARVARDHRQPDADRRPGDGQRQRAHRRRLAMLGARAAPRRVRLSRPGSRRAPACRRDR